MLSLLSGPPGLPVGFLLLQYSALCTVEALSLLHLLIISCLFVFVALRPMSTAMIIAGRSVHLTTLFPGQA